MCIVEAILVETVEVFTPLLEVAAVLLVIVAVVVEVAETGVELRVGLGMVLVVGMVVSVVVVVGALLGRVIALETVDNAAEDPVGKLLIPDKRELAASLQCVSVLLGEFLGFCDWF